MLQTYKSYTRRTLAMLLAVLVAVGALFSGSFPVHAADGTIHIGQRYTITGTPVGRALS